MYIFDLVWLLVLSKYQLNLVWNCNLLNSNGRLLITYVYLLFHMYVL